MPSENNKKKHHVHQTSALSCLCFYLFVWCYLRETHGRVLTVCGLPFVVQFSPWLKFYFPCLFLGMVMYDNEYKDF